VGLVAAVVVVMLLRTTGSLRASDDALVVMGFDPERASLITALLTGALAGGVVAAFGGLTAIAVVASVGATAALFWSVFRSETVVHAQHPALRGGGKAAHELAVRDQRADLEATAVKVEEHAALFTPRRGRPLAGDAAEIDAYELDIGRYRPDRSDFVDPRAPLGETLRPRLGTQ